jgi:sugar phosphate isomerase/epimerase
MMFRNLSPGAIGISADWKEALSLAKASGFEGVDLNLGGAGDTETYCKAHEDAGLKIGGWGLPVAWSGSEEDFETTLRGLPEQAKLAAKAGSSRCCMWVPSWHDELTFDEYYDMAARRFRACAEVLKDHGHRLALEFLGPKTLRDGHKHEFIHTLPGMLKLCEEIGTGNVGLLLDAWHWYTSHGTLEELHSLTNADVVYVHINDAPVGVAIDEQVDNVRTLPGETGVIDLTAFLRALNQIGYDGPVTPEPFSQRVREMSAPDAAKATGDALLNVWREALEG